MKEITMTFWNGLVSSVENIPKGQTVITRDVDEGAEEAAPLIVRRWYPGDESEIIYEGPLEGEPKFEAPKGS